MIQVAKNKRPKIGQSQTKKQDTIMPQLLTDGEVETIQMLHHRRMGWVHLLEITIGDKAVGFPCDAEEFAIRRELRMLVSKVADWFRITGANKKWPSADGLMWEIDFKAHKVMPKFNHSNSKQQEATSAKLTEGPIMALGDVDLEIYRRLIEKRAGLADLVRAKVREIVSGGTNRAELNTLIQELGAAEIDLRNWFSEMATTYKWPRSNDNNWFYDIDLDEKQVRFAQRGGCSCA